MNLLPAQTLTGVDRVHCCDALTFLRAQPSESVNCIVTSPPYFGLRDYGVDGQIGLEPTPREYVEALRKVFAEARRVLRKDGTLWLNLGDTWSNAGKWGGNKGYNTKQATNVGSIRRTAHNAKDIGAKPKDLLMIPARVAIALQDDGWYLRDEIVWHKPNAMPASVQDRTTRAHEMVYLLSKHSHYWYDADAIKEQQAESSRERAKYGWAGGTDDRSNGARTGSTFKRMAQSGEPIATIPVDGFRNKRSVWTIPTAASPYAHFATFPEDLIEPMILAGCPENGVVFDPFFGSGTTGVVAQKLNRHWLGCDINPEYVELARYRTQGRLDEYLAMKAGLPFTQYMFEVLSEVTA